MKRPFALNGFVTKVARTLFSLSGFFSNEVEVVDDTNENEQEWEI
jgi:hypothetical protein